MLSFRQAVLSTGLLLAFSLQAAELRDVTVERDDDRYKLRSETLFDTTQEDLYRVLTNYDDFEKFTSAFSDSRNLEPDEDGNPRFYTEMEGCVLFFCVTFERYGHLELQPETNIRAVVDPETSDFAYSVETWALSKEDDGVLLIYEFEMEPDFWVPPVIGPFYIRRALRDGAVRAVDRIEALAQGREPAYPIDD